MAGHHGAAVSVDPLPALIAEKNRLVRNILQFPRLSRCQHASTIEALGEFLAGFSGEGEIPWLRIYASYPAWQERTGLLKNQEWSRDALLKKAMVFFTLITVQGDRGGAISRKALGGGATWKTTGVAQIGNELVLGKLYFKMDGETTRGSREQGFTASEFHLPMDLLPRPRVAICILHPTDYHHTVRDLRDYIREGRFRQVVQHVPPIYQGPCVAGAGFINSPQVDYTSNLASNSGGWFPRGNLRMEQPSEQMYPDTYGAGAGFMNGPHDYPNNRDILGANQMAVQHEGQYLDSPAGFMNGLHVHCSIDSTESSGYYPPAGIQMDIPSNTCLMNDDMSHMPSEINMFGGQYSHANTMSIQRDYCNTSFWNSNMHAPIQDATTSYSQPLIHSSASLDEPFDQLLLSEYNSMPEPGGQNSHADGMSAQNYYYNPY